MPIYNTQAFLAPAIASIQTQSFSDWELLCLDDGSTDDSLSIAKQFAATDSRIKVIAGNHRG